MVLHHGLFLSSACTSFPFETHSVLSACFHASLVSRFTSGFGQLPFNLCAVAIAVYNLCVPVYIWRENVFLQSMRILCPQLSCIPLYLALDGSTQSHWRLHAESFAGSMRSHSPTPCGIICRLHAESSAGSMRSHLPAPCGVICRLHAEPFAGSAVSHLAVPSRAITLVARIGAPMEWHCPIQRHQLVQVPQPSALH